MKFRVFHSMDGSGGPPMTGLSINDGIAQSLRAGTQPTPQEMIRNLFNSPPPAPGAEVPQHSLPQSPNIRPSEPALPEGRSFNLNVLNPTQPAQESASQPQQGAQATQTGEEPLATNQGQPEAQNQPSHPAPEADELSVLVNLAKTTKNPAVREGALKAINQILGPQEEPAAPQEPTLPPELAEPDWRAVETEILKAETERFAKKYTVRVKDISPDTGEVVYRDEVQADLNNPLTQEFIQTRAAMELERRKADLVNRRVQHEQAQAQERAKLRQQQAVKQEDEAFHATVDRTATDFVTRDVKLSQPLGKFTTTAEFFRAVPGAEKVFRDTVQLMLHVPEHIEATKERIQRFAAQNPGVELNAPTVARIVNGLALSRTFQHLQSNTLSGTGIVQQAKEPQAPALGNQPKMPSNTPGPSSAPGTQLGGNPGAPPSGASSNRGNFQNVPAKQGAIRQETTRQIAELLRPTR